MDGFRIKPTPKQESFMFSPQRFGCYSGAYGGGKTYSGCLRSLILSSQPKNFGLIGRNTYVELRDSTRKTFFEICPPEYYDEKEGGRWSPTENHLRLVNGSEIIFRHLDTIAEKELLSMNLGWFFIDQAEEISINVWRVLQSRLRLNTVPRRFGFIACNPEPGTWIYEVFKRPHDEKRLPKDYFYVESSSYDNPYLPKEYIQTLIDSYPEELRKRYVEGRWDVFEGQIYPEFDRNIHVIRPFEIPKGWERIVSLDHGMVNPTGVLWGAIDYDGNLFITDEYYSPGVVSDHAKAIKEKTGDQEISLWVIDPSTQAKTREKKDDSGNAFPWSIIQEYEDHGLYFIPGNNERLAGINRVKEFFKIQDKKINPITGEKKSPRLFIFQNCVNLLWELPQYQWKKMGSMVMRNQRESPRDLNDHLLDACLIGSTKIKTEEGEKPLKAVKVGDRVMTRRGYKKVLASSMTNEKARVYKVSFSNKQSLVGTANHPIWVEGKGFVPLKEMRYGDMIRSCENIQTNIDVLLEERGKDYVGQYQKDTISTILMEIKRITTLRTWNVFFHYNIKDYIGRVNQFFIKNVRRVVKAIKRSRLGLNFVPIDVSQKIDVSWELTRSKGFVLDAERNFGLINMPQQFIAQNIVMQDNMFVKNTKKTANSVRSLSSPKERAQSGVPISVVSVTPVSKKTKVYNISVEDSHEYFANGILTHNCRYMIMARFPSPTLKPIGDSLISRIDRQNANLISVPMQNTSDPELGSFHTNVINTDMPEAYE